MPILLYCVGAICFAGGFAMAAYGIPVSEFSFGNTLIVAGATVATGGLVVFALGAVVSKLQQLADAGSLHMPASLPQAPESLESPPPMRPAGVRSPFPPRPKAEPRDLPPPVAPIEPFTPPEPVVAVAPTLPNPDEPPMAFAEAAPLSPAQPVSEPSGISEPEKEPSFDIEPKSAFDTEWPPIEPSSARRSPSGFKWPERKPAKPIVEEEPAPAAEPASEEPVQPVEAEPAIETPRPAVLKSGVVDGMGYTLYVDGSIEAELPQGTLRFASINELREHLEQNT